MTSHEPPPLTDRATVAAERAETYRRDGHVLIRGLADEAEIAAYQPVIRDVAMKYNRETRPLEERDVYGRAFLQVMNLWTVDEGVRRPFIRISTTGRSTPTRPSRCGCRSRRFRKRSAG